MTLSRLSELARPVLLVTAIALFADLLLDWREASVRTPTVDIDAGVSGWSGWGAVAGVLLIVYLAVELRGRRPFAGAALALLASAFTVVEFFTGEAHVDVRGIASVGTGDSLWPAYLGLVLAVVLAAGAVVRLGAAMQSPGLARPHGAA